MDTEQKEMFEKLINTIGSTKDWIGQTNREVRDEIATGAAEVSTLQKQMAVSTESLVINIRELTKSINTHSASNAKVSRWMVIFTVVLAISTVAMAVATVMIAIKP